MGKRHGFRYVIRVGEYFQVFYLRIIIEDNLRKYQIIVENRDNPCR